MLSLRKRGIEFWLLVLVALILGKLLMDRGVMEGFSSPFIRRTLTYDNPREIVSYNYPDQILPSNVIGCGGRRGGCLGGTQEIIPTVSAPRDISSANIAPITLATRHDSRNPLQTPHQVGVIYKVFGNNNEIYPLYGAKRYFNGAEWDYYTIIQQPGGMANKIGVRTKNRNYRLGNNDTVWLDIDRGDCAEEYRVTIYDNGIQYSPYI